MATSDPNRALRATATERAELDDLIQTFRSTAPKGSRRDLFRWGAVAAGAVATARFGVSSAGASPSAQAFRVSRYQDAQIEKNASIVVPLDPFGQPVTLDPHRTVNWGPFWALFPNVWGGLVRFDEVGKVQLDLAESYTVSDDGTIYTFKIR